LLDSSCRPVFSLLLALTCAGFSVSCVPADVGYQDVRRTTSERLHADVRWREIDGAKDAARRTKELLRAPLTADAAVQVALLNNRSLQASFEDLGVARAGLVRALRLPNPSADGAILFHSSGDRPELQLRAMEDLSELIVLPLRHGAAKAELEAAKTSVLGSVLDVAFATRSAFLTHQASAQLLELQETVLEATRASFEAAKGLHDAGNLTDLSFATERALYEETTVAHARARMDVVASRETLGALMGLLPEDGSWSVANRLPDLPEAELPVDTLERRALEKSFDLSLVKQRYEAARKRANYSRVRGFLPELGVGVEAERREEWGVGPAAAVSIPLFYQGQGEVGEALAEMRRQREMFADVALRVRAQARSLGTRLTTTRRNAAYYRDVLLPLRNQIVQDAQLEYNAMSIGVFQLLQARRDQIATARQYVDGLREYWMARSEAESLLAGRLSRAFMDSRSTMPATSTSTGSEGLH
jgi:cobalt-zinc-cadmium efflux system outer membrane protein